jgi:serine transporter
MRSPEVRPIGTASWVLTLFGTAVGAGILFLPIQGGLGGLWPLLLVAVLIYPTIYLGHHFYALIPSRSPHAQEFAAAAARWLPAWVSLLLRLLLVLWLLVLLIAYSISLTNDLGDLLADKGLLTSGIQHRIALSFTIIAVLLLALRFARTALIGIIGSLSLVLIGLLCLVSVALIPHWSPGIVAAALKMPAPFALLRQLLLLFPLLTLSFMFFPSLSRLACELRERIEAPEHRDTLRKRIIRSATLTLIGFVLIFIVSFILAVPTKDLTAAARENISALAMLGNLYGSSWLGDLGQAISILALTTSFLGIFIGYQEAFSALRRSTPMRKQETLLHLATLAILWPLAIADIPVMAILGDVVAPLGALFLFVVPAVLVLVRPELESGRGPGAVFTLVIGLVVVAAYFVGSAL